MPQGDVLEPDEGISAHESREPADPLGDDRVALVRHRRRALLARRERLLDLTHLGPREVPDLEREAVERGGEDREGGQELGVAVALEDLRRAGRWLEAQRLARDALDIRRRGRVGPDRTRELAHAHSGECVVEPATVALELERPAQQLETEGRRLGMDSVRPADRDRVAVLLRAGDDRLERAVDPIADQRSRVLHRERESGVEHVRRGEAVVEPAALRPELRRDASTKAATSWFVVRSSSATRSGLGTRARSRTARALLAGTVPTCAQASSAASSTSSHRSSFASSDQTRVIAGRA